MKRAEWEAMPAWVRAALAQRGMTAEHLAEVEWEEDAEPKLIRAREKPRVEVIRVEFTRET